MSARVGAAGGAGATTRAFHADTPPWRCIALHRPEAPRSVSSLRVGIRPSSATSAASSASMVASVHLRRFISAGIPRRAPFPYRRAGVRALTARVIPALDERRTWDVDAHDPT